MFSAAFEVLESRQLFASVAGTVYHDLAANGVLGSSDPGLAGQIVYHDLNTNAQHDISQPLVFSSSAPAQSILDQQIVYMPVDVSGLAAAGWGSVYDLTATVQLSHGYVGDLEIILVSPVGTQVVLQDGRGGPATSLDVTYDDAGVSRLGSAAGAVTGTFRPQGQLSSFAGESPDGIWYISVMDWQTGYTGTLTGLSLSFRVAERFTFSQSTGGYLLSDLPAGNASIRAAATSGGYSASSALANVSLATPSTSLTGVHMPLLRSGATGRIFDDANSSGTRENNETLLSGVRVFNDLNGNGIYDAPVWDGAAGLPVTLADGQTFTSNLPVSGKTGTLRDINVSLNLSTTYAQDITATLIADRKSVV